MSMGQSPPLEEEDIFDSESPQTLLASLLNKTPQSSANKQTGRFHNVHHRLTCWFQQEGPRWPWILSTFVSVITAGILLLDSLQRPHCPAFISLDTDLEPAREHITLSEQVFTGALTYNESGNLVIEQLPDQEVWVGDPTPEMDALWDSIEAGSMVLLQGKEAAMVRDRTTLYHGYWVTGLDVFHQLHCLNMVRKALYPTYYKPEQGDRAHKLHWEHCLDYVRQAVMCNADITPVTHQWYESAQTFGPNFATRHTCRNFNALLEWSLARSTAARDAEGLGSEVAEDADNVMCAAKLHGRQ